MFPEKNYVLGRGKLYFGKFAPDTRTLLGGLKYLGNTPEFNLSSESESLDHFDSDNGVRVKDDSALLELNRSGSFVCDHISPSNLANWFLGTESVVTQASLVAQTHALVNVRLDERYQIGETAGNPSGVRGLTAGVTVSRTDGGPIALVEGTDFVVDYATGGIVFKAGTNLPIADSGIADATITYSAAATTYNRVVTGSTARIEGRLLFVANNPKGLNTDYLFPYVQLRPDGDFALKGDDWQVLNYAFDALRLDDDTEVVYTNGRAGVGVP